MIVRTKLLIALLALTTTLTAGAASPANRLAELTRLATAGDDSAVLQLLQDTVDDARWPPDMREPLLSDFAQSLRALPPNAVGAEVIAFLIDYPPRLTVAHPDAPRAVVPRYNIRAAAHGVMNTWRRQEAAYAGSVLLARDAAGFVEAYLANPDRPTRQGLHDALSLAPRERLDAVSATALGQLGQKPDLATLAAESSLRAGDLGTLREVLRTGEPTGMASLLRRSAQILQPDRLQDLFEAVVDEGDARIAALAIAELTPALAERPGVEARLFELLGNPELGSAAALALAADADGERIERLTRLAASDSLAARRARVSLTLLNARLAGDRSR